MDAQWPWIGACLALLLGLAYYRRKLANLVKWLSNPDGADPPRAYGLWDDLHALLHRGRRDARRREAELVAAHERWNAAARALPDGVVILENERIVWCNETASSHFRVDAARDQGRPITHLVRAPEFARYLAHGDFARPIPMRPVDQPERMLSLQVVSYGEGQSLLLSRDVTRFEKLENMRREFVANVSHELRTPLTVVSGFLETLRDETDPEARARYIDLMGGQSQRMLRLLDDLLALSALESSPPPSMDDAVDMRALVERLAADARALSRGRHQVEVAPIAGLDLAGSEKELASAFGNLVSNAIRYTPEGGTVRLGWIGSPEGASFDVEDTGIGIAPEHIPRLTERFYRVDRGRSRESGGTGLGLAIVKHALGRHGATLSITSQPGQGSRFSARFTGPRLRTRAV